MVRFPQAYDKCLHPVKRYNVDGKSYSYVSCGNCLPCIQSKQKKWEYRLFDHLNCGLFTSLFITLTYDNEHLPLIQFDPDLENYNFRCTKFRPGKGKKKDKVVKVHCKLSAPSAFDEFLSNDLNGIKPNHIVHFVKRRYTNGRYFKDRYNRFAVCRKKDVQDFVCRLRKILARATELDGLDTTFTYFICSEYGPETFRPHYHGILFFNNQTVATYALSAGVFKAWGKQRLPQDRYGNKICKPIYNNQGAAAYVSKYVTGFSHLPAILHYKEFRPFHLQSISSPIGCYAISLDSFADMLARGNMLYEYDYIDQETKERITVKRPFSDSCLTRFFPKFLCHGCLDVSTITRLLKRILSFSFLRPIPDYRDYLAQEYQLYLPRHYGYTRRSTLNDLILKKPLRPYSHYYINREVYHFQRFPGYEIPEIPYYITGFNEVSVEVHKRRFSRNRPDFRTPAEIAPYFLECCGADTDNLDVFLFGFDYNRAVFKKLRLLALVYPWIVANPQLYIDLYLQYHTRKFSESFRRMSEFVDSACFTGKFTSAAFSAIYYDSLPPADVPIWDLTQEQYDRFNHLLSSFPGLSVEDFYDVNGTGKLLYSVMCDMPFYHSSYMNSKYKYEKSKNRKKEKHDASFNL